MGGSVCMWLERSLLFSSDVSYLFADVTLFFFFTFLIPLPTIASDSSDTLKIFVAWLN